MTTEKLKPKVYYDEKEDELLIYDPSLENDLFFISGAFLWAAKTDSNEFWCDIIKLRQQDKLVFIGEL